MNKGNKKELSLDMLENINGGHYTEGSETQLDEKIGALKKKYKTQKRTTEYLIKNYSAIVDPTSPMTKKEVIDYVKENWDLI